MSKKEDPTETLRNMALHGHAPMSLKTAFLSVLQELERASPEDDGLCSTPIIGELLGIDCLYLDKTLVEQALPLLRQIRQFLKESEYV